MSGIDPLAQGGPEAERRRGYALHSNAPINENSGSAEAKLNRTLVALKNKSHAGLDLHVALKDLNDASDDDGKVTDTETFARGIEHLKRRALHGADLSSQIQALEEIHEAAGGEKVPDPGFVPQEGNGEPVQTGHPYADRGTMGERQYDNATAQQAALIRDPSKKVERPNDKPTGASADFRNTHIESQRGTGSVSDPDLAGKDAQKGGTVGNVKADTVS